MFVDEEDRPLYIGISRGLLEAKATVIPIEIVRVNDKRKVVEVADSKDKIEHAPSVASEHDLTPELEDRIRGYFGLELLHPAGGVPHPQDPSAGEELADDERVDLVPGERDLDRELQGDAPHPDRAVERHEHLVEREPADETADAEEPAPEVREHDAPRTSGVRRTRRQD
jgi:hypothetical protein